MCILFNYIYIYKGDSADNTLYIYDGDNESSIKNKYIIINEI